MSTSFEKNVGEPPQHQLPTIDQLRDVRDQLRRPLSGREVLIPFGRLAFFPGRLTPATTTTTTEGSAEEMVRIHRKRGEDEETQKEGGGACCDVTRQQALDILQTEIDALTPTTNARRNTANASILPKNQVQPKKSALKKNTTVATSLPYFEIREELDDAGGLVRAETIDVSQHLDYLESSSKAASDGGSTKESPSGGVVGNAENGNDDGDDDDTEYEELTPIETALKPLSDDQYNALTSHLDKLALMEERAAAQQHSNAVSSKTLQSDGWSKGFLNKKKKKKSTSKEDKDSSSHQRVVNFAAQDEIQEIPRIGDRSIHQSTTSTKPTRTTTTTATRPLDDSLFSGVVSETKKVASTVRHHKQQQRPAFNHTTNNHNDNAEAASLFPPEHTGTTRSSSSMPPSLHSRTTIPAAAAAATTTTTTTKKRVSRFAQERQRNHG